MINVNVYGLGYIGLPTALFLANSGANVMGFDPSERVCSALKEGRCPQSEVGLDKMLAEAVAKGSFAVGDVIGSAEFHIICVPTPLNLSADGEHEADLSAVFDVVKGLIDVIRPGDVVILESTSPVGTTDMICEMLSEGSEIEKPSVAYCPERVLPGNLVFEMINNARIVGGSSLEVSESVAALYARFCEADIVKTSSKVAEMSKLVENAYRDVNIAFANSIDLMASEFDVDATEVIRLANLHPRVQILKPGIGVGGHCIPVDPWFLISKSRDADLLRAARSVNNRKTELVASQALQRIQKFEADNTRLPLVGLLGLSYKANVGDLRESPALKIAEEILSTGVNVLVHEPFATARNFDQRESSDEVILESDLVFILQAHKEYENVDANDASIIRFAMPV